MTKYITQYANGTSQHIQLAANQSDLSFRLRQSDYYYCHPAANQRLSTNSTISSESQTLYYVISANRRLSAIGAQPMRTSVLNVYE